MFILVKFALYQVAFKNHSEMTAALSSTITLI